MENDMPRNMASIFDLMLQDSIIELKMKIEL